MNADFVISILILASTVFAFLYTLSEQWRDHQPNLFKRILYGEGLVINFATLFLTGLGAIVGSYLVGALSSFLGIHGEDAKFVLGFLGFIIGLMVTRFYIVPKMVIPKFSQAIHDQEETTQPPLPPPES